MDNVTFETQDLRIRIEDNVARIDLGTTNSALAYCESAAASEPARIEVFTIPPEAAAIGLELPDDDLLDLLFLAGRPRSLRQSLQDVHDL